jgi:transposase
MGSRSGARKCRHELVEMRVRIDNQLRGILKTFGLVIGKCGHGQIGRRAQELAEGHPGIDCVVASMVAVRDNLLKQVAVFDRAIRRLAKTDDTARRLMTVTRGRACCGVGLYGRDRRSGALTPQRDQSGEVDLTGRISKCGDGFARTCLYEAAGVLLTRVRRWSPLKAWGVRLMKRVGNDASYRFGLVRDSRSNAGGSSCNFNRGCAEECPLASTGSPFPPRRALPQLVKHKRTV